MNTDDYGPKPLTNLQDFSYFAEPLTAKTAAWHRQAVENWAHDNADTNESCEFVSKAFGYELLARVSNIFIFPAALIDAICHIGIGAFTLLAVIPEKIYEWKRNRDRQAGEEGEMALEEYARKFTFGGACANFGAAVKYLGVAILGTAAGVLFDPAVAANMARAGQGKQLHEVLQSPLAKGHRKFQELGQEVNNFRKALLKDEVREGQELEVDNPETVLGHVKELFQMARARFEKKDDVSGDSIEEGLDEGLQSAAEALQEANEKTNAYEARIFELQKEIQQLTFNNSTVDSLQKEMQLLADSDADKSELLAKADKTVVEQKNEIEKLKKEVAILEQEKEALEGEKLELQKGQSSFVTKEQSQDTSQQQIDSNENVATEKGEELSQ